jgi:trimeric autotransporter adhesin
MGRQNLTIAFAVIALGASLSGCGEPLVVLGDAPGLMRVVLGVGDSLGTRVDTIATRTRLTDPMSVAFSTSNGVLYVADRAALRQINGLNTRVTRIFAVESDGRSRLLLDAGGCTAGPCIVQPYAMVLATDGSLVIADAAGNRVLRYRPGGAVTVLAGTGVAVTVADGAVAATSPVSRPSGVAVAADGRIFFSEADAHRIRVIGTDGRLSTFAGNGSGTHSGDGGPATAAGIADPAGLALRDGVLYIAEYGGHSVRAISAAGVISTVAGVGLAGFSGDGGAATGAGLNQPVAVTISADGRSLYISDQGNHRIRTVDLASGTIRTFAGTGNTAWAGNRLSAGATALNMPAGLDATANGFLFIADRGHSVVWRTSTALD